MTTIPPRPYELRAALIEMTTRYGVANANHAYACARRDWPAAERELRAVRRRFRVIQRLADALTWGGS